MGIKRAAATSCVALLTLAGGTAMAADPPPRSGTDPCNGTAAFDINNVETLDVVNQIKQQNPSAVRPDGSVDRAQITRALIKASGHLVLQLRDNPGGSISRITFEFGPTDPDWRGNSVNSPVYANAAEAREDPAAAAANDSVVGSTFAFLIPTDVVSDGNYIARFRAFNAAGTELGRLCIDAAVSNGQDATQAGKANNDPAYEPPESTTAGFGFAPQPMVWFPAAEPTVAQRAGYAARTARIEFPERLASAKLEREENLAAPTGLAGTASTTGGTLATGTYFYKVSALNSTGETLPSGEVSVPVTGPTGSVALSWTAVSGATGYRVYRGTAAGGQNVFFPASTTSFTDTGGAGTAGTPNPVNRAKIWVDYTARLTRDDWTRPHSVTGSRAAGTPLEPAVGNRKVWGPGYRLDFTGLGAEALPAERIRVTGTDLVAKRFCGTYTFSSGANGSFVPSSATGGC